MKFAPNFSNVELHTHLDGSFLPETILKTAQRRGIDFPYKTEREVKEFLIRKEPSSLREFLKPFLCIIPMFNGDKDAIYQASIDFIKQCAESKTCYVEARFCPEILSSPSFSPTDVVKTVLEAFNTAHSTYQVEARVILAGLREQASETYELIDLANLFKTNGVVGIDIAGDEMTSIECGGTHECLVNTFINAQKMGIHRTVHAGENGPAEAVQEAIFEMHAERLGHGYRCLENKDLYEQLKARNVHFEVCPSSSFLTGAVPNDAASHPIHQFVKDQVNYSINTDDVMITGRNLIQEHQFCRDKFQLTDHEIRRTTLCAAKSAFLPDDEKDELLVHLKKFGIA